MEKAKNPSIQGDFQQDLRATIGQSKTYHFSAKKNTNQTTVFAKICQLSSIHIAAPRHQKKITFENTLTESFISTTGALVVLTVSEVSIPPSSQHFIPIPITPPQRSKHVLIYPGTYVTVQCGRTFGAINEVSISSQAI